MTSVNYEVENGIALLIIDSPPVNAMNHAIRSSLAEELRRAINDESVDAVVITGAGGNFMAGVDIREFGKPRQSPTLRELIAIIESSPKPVIAAIDGFSLGGGLELALACHWRVATACAELGLPEVKLGLIPGGGGTQRLPRLTGPETALDLITSGKSVDAGTALEYGIIDKVISGELRTGAVIFAREVVDEHRPLRITSRLEDKIKNVDMRIFDTFRQKTVRKARGQHSPLKCIDSIEAACTMPFEEGYRYEQETFHECEQSRQRRAMIHVFFAERKAGKIPDIPEGIDPLPVRSAAVIGAGTMGAGIAMSFANAGIPVRLSDLSNEALERGIQAIENNYSFSVERGSLSFEESNRTKSLIKPCREYDALGEADIIIEAVFEDMVVKKDVFKKIDRAASPHAVLATNTSTLDIDEIASVTTRPGNVIGMHFFSPANIMKLLENVRGEKTSSRTIATAIRLGKRLGKIPVLARNCDGFIGNRMLRYYMSSAEFLLEEGAAPEQIDRVIMEFGFPMGPLAVRDLVGIDIGWSVRKAYLAGVPEGERVSPILQRLYETGRYGQKTGAGFYRYEGRKAVSDPEIMTLLETLSKELGIERREIDDDEILSRLLHPLVNEGARIVEERIAVRASDIDVVYVHGYGFPAHRGGPMYWGESIGLDKIYETMLGLGERFGGSWRPASLLKHLVERGGGWNGS